MASIIWSAAKLFLKNRGLSPVFAAPGFRGSGEVALILDVQALVSRSARAEEQASRGNTGTRRLEMH